MPVASAGFLQAAAEQFKELPPAVGARSAAAWQQLAAAEPPHLPCDALEGMPVADSVPMQRLLQLAAEAPTGQQRESLGEGPEAMAVDGEPQAAAPPAEQAEEEPGVLAVRRSLYHLLSAMQDAEVRVRLENQCMHSAL